MSMNIFALHSKRIVAPQNRYVVQQARPLLILRM